MKIARGILGALFLGLSMGAPTRLLARAPNIVFILADDLGWSDLSLYADSVIETPHLERLAAEGTRFTNFYAAAPVCSPTRASVITGLHPARLGITDFIPGHWRPFERLTPPEMPSELPAEVSQMGSTMAALGYRTGYFGKWHLGGRTHYPDSAGFETFAVTSGGHRAPRFRSFPESEATEGQWLIDWLTDRGMEFIEASDDRPFFIFLAHYAPHIPLDAPEDLVAKYRRLRPSEDRVWNPTYAAMVEQIDLSVGRLVEFLATRGLDDETYVVFTSDNGGLTRTYTGRGEAVTENTPLRDEKGSLYEGGIRVPLIVRPPGGAALNRLVEVPAMSVDFLPTFVELAGASVDGTLTLSDGASLVSLWSQPKTAPPQRPLYFHYPHYHHSKPASATRSGPWKLIEFFSPERVELFNLTEDPGETENLAEAHPEIVDRLRGGLDAWRRSVGARMPRDNPAYDPAKAHEWWSRRRKVRVAP